MPPDEQELQTLYHPENPAAIIPRDTHSGTPLPARHAGATGQFVWGMSGNATSFLLALIAPVSYAYIVLLTPVGMAFAVMGVMYGKGLLAEGRAARGARTATSYGHVCRISGFVLVAVHTLSFAAWMVTVAFDIPPLLG